MTKFGHGRGRGGFVGAGPTVGMDLGLEPPILAVQARGAARLGRHERAMSARWLGGIVLTGLAGVLLILGAVEATLRRGAVAVRPPEVTGALPLGEDLADADLSKGDRLFRTADVVAEKQSFQSLTTVTVGDKQVIRPQSYVRLATTLTTAPTDLSDQVPPFNPLRLLAADLPDDAPVPAPDAGPSLDPAEVAFQSRDLGPDEGGFADGGLSLAEARAQVAAAVRAAGTGGRGPLPLPPQLLLVQTSRAGLIPAPALGYGAVESPFSSMDVRMVPENVTVVPRTDGARDGAAETSLVVLHHGETLDDVLRQNGATPARARAIVAAFGARPGEQPVSEGRRLRIDLAPLDPASPARGIARLSVYLNETLEATVAITDAGRYVKVEAVDPGPARAASAPNAGEQAEAGGLRLYDSLYQTALKQGLPASVIDTMIRIFSNDVDFQQAVQGGDSLDALYSDGEEGDARKLLFASLTVRDETFRYFRFRGPDDPGPDYYDDDGRSVHKFLIRNPVPNGVFTSPFGMRFHPILGYSRPHTGVDWAAPVGTPILASGNGTVLKAERSPSYGNHVEIQHANDYVTTYSHMVGFARGIAEGVRVRQGQVIGFLGQTGLATGPHLHYEVIVNGHFVDPMRVKLAQTRELDGRKLGAFKREHDRIAALMANAQNGGADALQRRAAN